MNRLVVALTYSAIAFNIYLAAVYVWFEGSALPYIDNLYLACAFFVSFLALLIVQLTPNMMISTEQRIWLAILSLLYIPAAVLIFAFVYRDMGVENANQKVDYVYFSVVTFTTLGYGDLLPKGMVRLVASAQAIMGFLFMPLLISVLFSTIKEAADEYKSSKAAEQERLRQISMENE